MGGKMHLKMNLFIKNNACSKKCLFNLYENYYAENGLGTKSWVELG